MEDKNNILIIGLNKKDKIFNSLFTLYLLFLITLLLFFHFIEDLVVIYALSIIVVTVLFILQFVKFKEFIILRDDFLYFYKNKKQIEKKININDIFDVKTNIFTSRIQLILKDKSKINVNTFSASLIFYIIMALSVIGLECILYRHFCASFMCTKIKLYIESNKKDGSDEKTIEEYNKKLEKFQESGKSHYILCWIFDAFFVISFVMNLSFHIYFNSFKL